MNGCARLPARLSRQAQQGSSVEPSPPNSTNTKDSPYPTAFTATIFGLPKRSLSSWLSKLSIPAFLHRQPDSPVNQTTPITPTQIIEPSFPHLRGGGGSPDEIPPTLFWLAGGLGKPISFSGWKQTRPKQRMGSLFGMMVFGKDYGKEYKVEASGVCEVDGEAEVECSASVGVAVEEVSGVKSVKKSASALSSSSGLSVSLVAAPAKEVAASVDEVAPVGHEEPAKRASTPSSSVLADNVPLCSGALPTVPISSAPGQGVNASLPRDVGSQKDRDGAPKEQKMLG